jgi:aminopeptidase N
MAHRLTPLALGLLLGLAGCNSLTHKPASGPALTPQTLSSGGIMPDEQRRVNFDHAQLHFTVNPAQQSIDANAVLTFTAKSSIDTLLLDLDRNLPISRITLDGRAVPASDWSNPDGRLRIHLPSPLATGGRVDVAIAYGAFFATCGLPP